MFPKIIDYALFIQKLTPSGNEFKQFEVDLTHNPSKHLTGAELGQDATLH